MNYYQTKTHKLPGTQFSEVLKKAEEVYRQIKRRSKRTPYIRSAYFRQQKIFLTLFWSHLHSKMRWQDKIRRVKYYPCAIELLTKSRIPPTTRQDPNRHDELLHRFSGLTPEQEKFYVQVKEDKRTGKKYLLSIFPE